MEIKYAVFKSPSQLSKRNTTTAEWDSQPAGWRRFNGLMKSEGLWIRWGLFTKHVNDPAVGSLMKWKLFLFSMSGLLPVLSNASRKISLQKVLSSSWAPNTHQKLFHKMYKWFPNINGKLQQTFNLSKFRAQLCGQPSLSLKMIQH